MCIVSCPLQVGESITSLPPSQCSCQHVFQCCEVFWITNSRNVFTSCPQPVFFFFLRKQSCQLLIHRPNKRFHQKNALFTWNKITHRAGTLLVFKICGWAETKLGRWVVEMRRTRWFGFGEGTETDPADQWDRKRKTKLTVHPEVCSFTNQIVERSPSGLSTPLRRLTRNSCLGKR